MFFPNRHSHPQMDHLSHVFISLWEIHWWGIEIYLLMETFQSNFKVYPGLFILVSLGFHQVKHSDIWLVSPSQSKIVIISASFDLASKKSIKLLSHSLDSFQSVTQFIIIYSSNFLTTFARQRSITLSFSSLTFLNSTQWLLLPHLSSPLSLAHLCSRIYLLLALLDY